MPPGEGHDHAAHAREIGKQLALLLLQIAPRVVRSTSVAMSSTLHSLLKWQRRPVRCPAVSSASGNTLTPRPPGRLLPAFTSRTPCVERPAWRISPDSMRMILPFLVMIIRSESSFTERTPTTLPILLVVFMLMTPLPPRAVSR